MPITLTNPITVTAGSTVQESDLSAAITFVWIDFVAQQLCIIMENGTVSGSNFTPGQEVPVVVQLTMDLTTGNWTTTSNTSGTANPAVLAAQIAQFKASRNGGEQFMLANGAVAGTYTPWP